MLTSIDLGNSHIISKEHSKKKMFTIFSTKYYLQVKMYVYIYYLGY